MKDKIFAEKIYISQPLVGKTNKEYLIERREIIRRIKEGCEDDVKIIGSYRKDKLVDVDKVGKMTNTALKSTKSVNGLGLRLFMMDCRKRRIAKSCWMKPSGSSAEIAIDSTESRNIILKKLRSYGRTI